MTRSIPALASAILLGLTTLSLANPSPTPSMRVKRFKERIAAQQTTHTLSSPTPLPKTQSTRSLVGELPRPSSTSGRGGNNNGPAAPVSVRSMQVPTGGSQVIFWPNESNDPDSPSAGPGLRRTESLPKPVKSQSNVVTSTATHKVTKVLIPSLPKNSAATSGGETSIDANPPSPSELGPPVILPIIPRYDAVPRSKALSLPAGNIPVPADYAPPTPDPPAEISPTALRAWNGEVTRETRTFDQTRVQVTSGADGARRWQFFWRATGAKPRAARWEISTVPFVNDQFPPPGLVAYGDASVDAQSPANENFFSVEFNSLTKNFGKTTPPGQLYLRVVPVDGAGNPAAPPSNWVRIDIR